MVLHASLTSFRKLSIPRDSYAAIPNCGEQKINASLACNTSSTNGNPAATIKTVENFLGIDINHIVIVDFDGFAELHQHARRGDDRRARTRTARRTVPSSAATSTAARSRAASPSSCRPARSRCRATRRSPTPGSATTTATRRRTTATGPPASSRSSTGSRTASPASPASPTTSSRARSSAGTHRRRSSATWAASRCPQVAIAAILGGSGETNVLGGNKAAISSGPGRQPPDPAERLRGRGQGADRAATRRTRRVLARGL